MADAFDKKLSNTEITAAGIVNALNNFTPVIIPGELIVGFNYSDSKYNNLAVRVLGFSQKFNLISTELQDHIIGRTKHSCL